MKRFLSTAVVVIQAAAVTAVCAQNPHSPQPTPLSLDTVFAGLSPDTSTSLAARTFWDSARNLPVRGTAAVVEVKGGWRGAELYLVDTRYPNHRGYNIVLVTTNKQAAGTLKPGDTLEFEGTLYRYSARDGRPLVVTLAAGRLIQSETTADPASELAEARERFAAFADLLTREKNTAIGIRQNWELLRKLGVTWTGIVAEVKGGRGRAEVYLAGDGAPLYRGYNIIVVTEDVRTAGALVKGQRVVVTGIPHRYVQRRGHALVVTLRSGLFASQ